MTGALITAFRTNGETVSTLAASHDTQLIGTWLQVDVQSAAASGVTADPMAGPDCPVADPTGHNVVRIPYAPGSATDPTSANYRLETVDGQLQLMRYVCRNGTTTTKHAVATNLSNAVGSVTGDGPFVVTVTITEPVKTVDGTVDTTVKYSATSRTPAPTLTTFPPSPPATAPAPYPPCNVTAPVVVSPALVGLVSGSLAQDVSVTATTSGVCLGLQVSFQPRNRSQTRNMVQNGSTWTYVIPGTGSAGAVNWTAGPHPITVLNTNDATAPIGTLTVGP